MATETSKPQGGIPVTSPLYLHPSDSPGASITSCIFNGENYETWEKAVRNALRAKNKLGLIDGTVKRSKEEGTLEAQAWDICNSMLISWLFNVIDQKLHPSITYAESAKALWDDLRERFSIGNAPRIYQLKSELASLKQGDKNVMGYYTRLKAMWDELWSYSKVPNCVCGAAAAFVKEKEEERVHQFLMGLNDELFGTIRSQILAMDPLPSIGRAYAMVIQEEKHKSVTRGREDKSDTAAFAVYARGRDRNQQQREENKSNCMHCGKYGHDVSDCFQINGYPPNWGSRGTGQGKGKGRGSGRGNGRGGTGVNAVAAAINVGNGQQTGVTKGGGESIQGLGFTPDQVQQILALIEQSPSGQEKLTGNTSDLFTEGRWLIDTGASHHVTGYMKLLIDIHEKSSVTIGLPNGAQIIATKHRKARVGENIILQNVLFVPSLRCNLISVGQLMRELNCVVTFSPNLCVIQDRSTKNLIGVGELEDGVYYLRTRKGEKALRVTSSIRGELWHRRMGHPSSQISNFLSSLVGSDLDKFGSRASRCVMMGYPYGKKGWKVYDLENGEMFTSRDVVFHEEIFPFIRGENKGVREQGERTGGNLMGDEVEGEQELCGEEEVRGIGGKDGQEGLAESEEIVSDNTGEEEQRMRDNIEDNTDVVQNNKESKMQQKEEPQQRQKEIEELRRG
ncbi:hypothetical protein F0562_020183 [Nyssa sinensis]|uniref:CCHC-type domain-containing protein n=1 Tax=Nyssa sinensis TaxID=561372 RepID=A0A5J5BR45_9ASTE|nr:hypothetical protein F0562_020183 [Nyssa sinensis]